MIASVSYSEAYQFIEQLSYQICTLPFIILINLDVPVVTSIGTKSELKSEVPVWSDNRPFKGMLYFSGKGSIYQASARFDSYFTASLFYSVLFCAVLSYVAVHQGFMLRTACIVPDTIVGGIPLAVLLWWQPKMRQIPEKRLQWKRREFMSNSKVLAFSILAAAVLMCAQAAPAQVSIGVNIGAAPVCPYGYFDYAPYDCAPYGYYGPDWFVGGVFLGAGPWFHGPRGFFGHVDNRYDPHYGYHGPLPGRGEAPFNHFHGNEARDGRGHIGPAGHDAGNERALPGYRGGSSHGGSHGGGHH